MTNLRRVFGRELWPALAAASWLITANAALPDNGVEAKVSATADAVCQQGLAEYEIGHYAQAVQYFRSAAELGDARSPELLALMYRLGERLYGDQVRADALEAALWAGVAADRRRAANTAAISAKQ